VTTTTGGVLLVDLENMVGKNAKPGIVAARMQALIQRAGPGAKIVAACAQARITPDGAKVLQAHDVELLPVDGSKDAADEALLTQAQRMANDGCRRFVVASNDSRFARLAELGDLEIVIWKTQKPRKAYTDRAAHVHRLPIPAAAAAQRSTTSTKAHGAANTKASSPHKTHPPVTPKSKASISASTAKPATATKPQYPQLHYAPTQSGLTERQIRPTTAGIAILAAGVIFGAGAALGDLTVRRLLRHVKWTD
jgi:hypothetical protein